MRARVLSIIITMRYGTNMKKTIVFSATITALLFPLTCFAENPPKGGFESEVTTGVIFIDNANNLNPKGSKSTLTSLESAPKRKLSTLPVFIPEVSYRFGDTTQYAWYFNTRPPLEEAGEFVLSSGVKYIRPGFANFETGVFFVPFAEIWKNPYLLHETRKETDVTAWGAQFSLDRVFDTELRLNFAYLNEDVDNDDLAMLLPDLARDGAVYSVTLGYRLFAESIFPIRPKLSLRKGEYDGESSSFTKIKAEISGQYLSGRIFLMPSIYSSYKEHDEKDPIFDRTRTENSYGLNVIVKYFGLFDIQPLSLMGIAAYSRGEANENFYDTESLVFGLGLSYRL